MRLWFKKSVFVETPRHLNFTYQNLRVTVLPLQPSLYPGLGWDRLFLIAPSHLFSAPSIKNMSSDRAICSLGISCCSYLAYSLLSSPFKNLFLQELSSCLILYNTNYISW